MRQSTESLSLSHMFMVALARGNEGGIGLIGHLGELGLSLTFSCWMEHCIPFILDPSKTLLESVIPHLDVFIDPKALMQIETALYKDQSSELQSTSTIGSATISAFPTANLKCQVFRASDNVNTEETNVMYDALERIWVSVYRC
uniref:DENN domain-containing protein 5B n=1 Tax=Panagrellus redivivus TaxID=6233 RepID=A0A7E4V0G6_PANRE